MRINLQAAVVVLLLTLASVVPTAQAARQDSQPAGQTGQPDSEPATDADDQPAVDSTEDESKKKKIRFGLYAFASVGLSGSEPLNTSLVTNDTSNLNFGTFELTEMEYVKAAIGWKLANRKGDFRLVYQGYNESGFSMQAIGCNSSFDAPQGHPQICEQNATPWLSVVAENGWLGSAKVPASFEDLNSNGVLEPDEMVNTLLSRAPDTNGDRILDRSELEPLIDRIAAAPEPDELAFEKTFTESLGNRIGFVELLYGREFGGRRYSARWWAGGRYFKFEGNIIGGGRLQVSGGPPGGGFTDASLLQPITFSQLTEGFGATAALEADFNFFDKRLVLYLYGQTAFVVQDLTASTPDFFVLASDTSEAGLALNVPLQQSDERSKSSWQNTAEGGVRYNMRNGLQFELAYNVTGFLDVVLYPELFQIPELASGQEVALNTNTQDLVFDSWRFGIGFQW